MSVAIIDTSKITIPIGFFEEDLNVPKLFKWLYSQPAADVMSRDEVAKIFEEIDKFVQRYCNETHYSIGDMVWDIKGLEEKYTKGDESDA